MNCLSVDILNGPRNNVGSQDQGSQGKDYRNTPFFTLLYLTCPHSCKFARGHGTVTGDSHGIWCEVDDGKVKGKFERPPSFLLPIVPRASYIRVTFTANGKREFVPRDHVLPLFVFYN